MMKLILLLVVCCVVVQSQVVPFKYPLFKQCDPQWAKVPIGSSTTQTICSVGCLMSSVSMALNGKNISIDGVASNPEVLNSWLQNNNGYVDSDDLEENVVPSISPSRISWVGPLFNNTALTPDEIKSLVMDMHSIVIINVMEGRHFVLVVGFDSGVTNFYVNDPGFDTQFYTYEDIVGYRIFTMK